jgi:hypothetical protein
MFSGISVSLLAVAAVVLAGGIGGAYLVADRGGYARCERDTAFAVSQGAEEAHQFHLAEVARGDAISAELSKVQQKLKRTEYEYHTYANAITGVCDPSFRVFVEYASGAKDPLPAATSTPPDSTAPETPTDPTRDQAITRAIAANVAINYARLDACVAGYNALIDWHQPKEAVNE